MSTTKPDLAFLGPKGTFSDIVSRKSYGEAYNYIPLPTVDDVFHFVAEDSRRLGVVPIENSSGGIIHPTIDHLVTAPDTLRIKEELLIRVNLALACKKDNGLTVERVYSHFAPLHHCENWLKANMPKAERVVVSSTAEAASKASVDDNSAALCTRDAAELYGLKILCYPVQQDVENITQFFCIGHGEDNDYAGKEKTSIIMTLPNIPGSLLSFLSPLNKMGVNLTRIISRPIVGHPQKYNFLVDLAGPKDDPSIEQALEKIKKDNLCSSIRLLGSYSVHEMIES